MKNTQVNKTLTGKSAKDLLKLIDGEKKHKKSNNAVKPSSEVEKGLFDIWKNILGHDDFGIEDDFFFIGGNSIKAIHLISKISRELNVQFELTEIFLHPTISGMASFIDAKKKLDETPEKIEVQDKPALIPLSFSQERLWFVNQLEGSRQFHNPSVLRLKGKPDKAALEKALYQVVDRHETLRTVINENNDLSYLKIIEADNWKLNLIDGNKFRKDKEGLKKFIQELISAPFDLSKDHMLRASLISVDEDDHLLVVTMHHIASDAWSMYIIVREVIEIYQALTEGRTSELRPLSLQYSDYAIWQRNYLQGNILDEKLEYWKNKLNGAVPLELPSDFVRPAVKTTQGETLPFNIEKELLEKLNTLSQLNGSTLFMTLLTAFKILLYKYSGQSDITVGTSMINRSHQEFENLIGLFVNTLALRSEINSDKSFADLLKKVRQTTLDAYQHQDVPFEKIVDAVVKERDSGISPLFQVMLVMNAVPEISQFKLGDVKLSEEEFEDNISKFDLTIFLTETGNNLRGYVQFRTDLFTKQTVGRFISHFTEVLNSIVKDPEQNVREIQILTNNETKQLLENFSQSTVEYPRDKTVKDIFEEQVNKTPDAEAVMFEGKTLTYREINERANQIANYLRSKGADEKSFVPVFMESGLDMMTAILGILKSGAAYVPVDSDVPAERLSFIVEDTKSKIILCSSLTKSKLENINAEAVEIDFDTTGFLDTQSKENLKTKLKPDNLAYVIYTSGSTGTPKGVMIEHRSLIDYVYGLDKKVDVKSLKSFALVSTIATDLGNTVIYSSLLSGGKLHLFSKESVSNPEYMHKYFSDNKIECIKIVPSHWKALKSGEKLLLPEKLLVFGGEALQSELFENICSSGNKCRVVNHYGPTETTIGKLLHIIEPDRKYNHTIPIGKPFSNTCVFILSKEMQLCPVGVPGELYIGGDGTARGYLNNDVLTKKKFIQSPFDKNKILYSTGDLVKYLPDGNIEFIGRADDQVKVRGYRIEPGEIENALRKCESVRSATVLAREDKSGNKRLVAYIIPEGKFLREEVISYLKEKLPEYMVPAMFVEMEKFPLTSAGKIDRRSLPDPDVSEQLTSEYSAPGSKAENVLAEIWKELLDLDKIGVHDNFFELGGDSIISIQLVSRARRAGYELQIGDVFTYQTIARLSALLEQRSGETAKSKGEQEVLEGECGLLPIQQWYFEKENDEVSYFNQSVLLSADKSVSQQDLKRAVEQLSSHHDALRFKYYRKDNEWHQVYGEELEISEVINLDLSKADKNSFEKLLNENNAKYQRSLDIEKGELMRVVLIQTPDTEKMNRLLIIIHHLAVDGVSWRIILEDLENLITEIKNGKSASLGKKSSSYRQWYQALEKFGRSKRLNSQKKYWEEIINYSQKLPEDKTFNDDLKLKDIGKCTVRLNNDKTRRLMQDVNKTYHTEINDVLIAALAKTLCDRSDDEKVLIEMEGHGRETAVVGEDTDVGRSVGWFTTHYPVLVNVEKGNEKNLIKSVKEQLRRIPDKGIGYGVLKYIVKDPAFVNTKSPGIIFNYLGQTDNVMTASEWFKLTEDSAGFTASDEYKIGNKISVAAMIQNGEMVFNWNYSKMNYNEQTINDLSKKYLTNLETLINLCMEKVESEYTPSDFGLAEDITYKDLDKFFDEEYDGKPRRQALEGIYKLSGLQHGMMFHDLYGEDTGTYLRQFSCDLKDVDTDAFIKSWENSVQSHAALRSAFYPDSFKIPVRCVYKEIKLPVEISDQRKLSDKEKAKVIQKFEKEDLKKGFDLKTAPLMRMTLIRTGDDTYRMIWTWHHLLFDGWSMAILMEKFLENYSGIINGKEMIADEKDSHDLYLNYIEKIDRDDEETYWREYMKGVTHGSLLPFIQSTTERTKGSGEYKSLSLKIDPALNEKINSFAQSQRLTLNTIMQGVWSLLLSKYTGSEEVVFGIVVSGRPEELPDIENKVGMFINTLPLHSTIKNEDKVKNYFNDLQTRQITSNKFQYSSLKNIQNLTGVKGDLFDSLLVFENYPLNKLTEEKLLKVSNVSIAEQTNYPLTILVNTSGETEVSFKFNTRLLKEAFVAEIKNHFENVLSQIISDEKGLIGDIELLDENEKEKLISRFDATNVNYPKEESIVSLFQKQVSKSPDNIALIFENEKMTYRELNERSNQLANYLKSKGVGKETLVPICMERSIEMIIGILGILKAGGVYVPADPDYPTERIGYIIDDTNAAVVLSSKEGSKKIPENKDVLIVKIDEDKDEIGKYSSENPETEIIPNDLAYIIYTSGSTGKPKGVMIEHNNVVRLFFTDKKLFDFSENDVWTMFHSFCFDFSVWEMYGALFFGGKLVIVPKHTARDQSLFLELLVNENVTVLNQTPSSFYVLEDAVNETVNESSLPEIKIRYVIFGGEALKPGKLEPWKKLFPECKLINMYGITETTVHVTYKELTQEDIDNGRSLIGKPIPTLSLYVLDKEMKPVPAGVNGEIYVGGAGLARGYLNQPDLSKEKFVNDPFSIVSGQRLYRTGDLGRITEENNIEYLGRIDEQVKIRGFRIELGEIESVLHESGMIKQNIVLAREDANGNKRLIGYVVPENVFDKDKVLNYLQTKLPEYMVPQLWVELESMPLTSNGKIDKKSLPDPDARELLETEYAAPRNEAEEKLAMIWKDLLNVDRVGIYDNFFELGGDSIITIQAVSRARREGYELKPKDIFIYQTISSLAEAIKKNSAESILAEQGILTGECGLLPVQQWYFETGNKDVSHFNQSVLLEIDKSVDEDILRKAVKELISFHDALRFKYFKKDEQWHQEYVSEIEVKNNFSEIDLTNISKEKLETEINNSAENCQRSLNIEKGELTKFVLIKMPDKELKNRLLIVIHHLAVDGVSWRILLNDLELLASTDPGSKGSSYRQWYLALEEYSKSKKLLSQIPYWEKIVENNEHITTDKKYEGIAKSKDTQIVEMELDPVQTQLLIREISGVYHTEINDILLCALAMTLCEYNRTNRIFIGLEGHGRENISDAINTTRTVGWFTNIYPVLLEVNSDHDLSHTIRSVKEQIRLIPDKGIGYGVLRYLNKNEKLKECPDPDVMFNYLGQFDNVAVKGKIISAASESKGTDISGENSLRAKLMIYGYIQSGKFILNWRYSTLHFENETVTELSKKYKSNLELLISHCLEQLKKAGEVYTPSDYGLADEVSVEELDKFLQSDDKDNIMSF